MRDIADLFSHARKAKPEREALKKLGGGGAPKMCILQNQQGGPPKKLNR